MLPPETQRLIEQHGIKYVLAQFVDIHGSSKTKSVPVTGLAMVAEDGAGFAGFAICGMGMEPHGPDFMAKGDLSSLTRCRGSRATGGWCASAMWKASPGLTTAAMCCKNRSNASASAAGP